MDFEGGEEEEDCNCSKKWCNRCLVAFFLLLDLLLDCVQRERKIEFLGYWKV